MTTPEALHTAVLVRLRAVPNLTVYDGSVPTTPPADASGRTYPYVVVWPSAGYRPNEIADSIAGTPDETLEWPVQVTVAGGDPTWVLQAATRARRALAGVFLTPQTGRLREEPGAPLISVDPDVKPARFFLPLLFRTQGA